MAGRIIVHITAGSETRELQSPRLDNDRVQQDLQAIRQAQDDGRMIELDWLSVAGGNVVSAHVLDIGD